MTARFDQYVSTCVGCSRVITTASASSSCHVCELRYCNDACKENDKEDHLVLCNKLTQMREGENDEAKTCERFHLELKPSPTYQGLGVFALKDYNAHELIISELPVLISPCNNNSNNNNFINDKEEQEAGQCSSSSLVLVLKESIIFQQIHTFPSNKKDLIKLSHQGNRQATPNEDDHVITNVDLVMNIFRSNCFRAANSAFSILNQVISRFNHSCDPNAVVFYNEGTGFNEVFAMRRIGKAEEITIVYCNPLQPKRIRQQILQIRQKFSCQCNTCLMKGNNDGEEELWRKQIHELECKVDVALDQNQHSIALDLTKARLELLLQHPDKVSFLEFCRAYHDCFVICKRLKNYDESLVWLQKHFQLKQQVLGSSHYESKRIQSLMNEFITRYV